MDLLSVCCASTWAAKEMRTCRSALSVGESCARSHQNGPTQTCGINSMSCTKQDWWFFNKNRLVALSAKFCKICSQIFIQIHARLKRVISIAIRLSSFNLIIVFVLFCTIYIYTHNFIYIWVYIQYIWYKFMIPHGTTQFWHPMAHHFSHHAWLVASMRSILTWGVGILALWPLRLWHPFLRP